MCLFNDVISLSLDRIVKTMFVCLFFVNVNHQLPEKPSTAAAAAAAEPSSQSIVSFQPHQVFAIPLPLPVVPVPCPPSPLSPFSQYTRMCNQSLRHDDDDDDVSSVSSRQEHNAAAVHQSSFAAAAVINRHQSSFMPPFSRHTLDVLTTWYSEHHQHPYPTDVEVVQLAGEANISVKQTRKWLAIRRLRSRRLKH